MKFMKWLWTRCEKEIAIVSHSGFLFHTLSAFENHGHQLVKSEIYKHFANFELCSMVFHLDGQRDEYKKKLVEYTDKGVTKAPDEVFLEVVDGRKKGIAYGLKFLFFLY